MAGKLAGQVVFVTGASRGIGKNMALQIAKEGANVVVAARTEEPNPRLPGTIHTVAEQIEALGTGAHALAVRCNVADEDSIREAVERALKEFGQIDALINNAGIMAPSSIIDQEPRHFDLVFRVNVKGAFLCMKFIVPHMMARGSGTVINISSMAARQGTPGNASYCISKRADELLIEALAGETREQGIRAFSLQPQSIVLTEGAMFLDRQRGRAEREPEPPEAMGQAAVWLLADAPAELSGRHFFSQSILRDLEQGKVPEPIAT